MARKPHHQMPSAHSQQERFGARDEHHGTGKVTSAVAQNHAAILRAITNCSPRRGTKKRGGGGGLLRYKRTHHPLKLSPEPVCQTRLACLFSPSSVLLLSSPPFLSVFNGMIPDGAAKPLDRTGYLGKHHVFVFTTRPPSTSAAATSPHVARHTYLHIHTQLTAMQQGSRHKTHADGHTAMGVQRWMHARPNPKLRPGF